MSWKPEDNFYPEYSILEDIGNTSEEEIQRIEKILQNDNIDINETNIKSYMELTRELMPFLKNECKGEIQEFSEYIRKEKFVGTSLPIELMLAELVVSEILLLISLGIKDILKNTIKKIKKYIKKRKEEKNIKEQTEVVIKIIKKIEKNGRMVENFEISLKKISKKE